jgi:uncharacterized delta-60 repeat protein
LPLLEIFFGSSVSTPPPLLVQPDSKILVAGITRNSNAPASPVSRLFRFLPTGQPDPGFANLTAVPTNNAQSVLGSVQLLPNGQLLVAAGSPNLGLLNFSPATAAPTGVALLNANGSRDAGFNPTVQDYGTVAAVVQQTDGKLLIGGDFTYYNGQPARNLARLLPDGALDVAFQANGGNADDVVTSLLLLPTGQLAVGGRFRLLAGSVRTGLGQLLPSGALDPGFAPAVINNPGGLLASMWQLTRQADGKLLGIYGYDNSIRYLVRYDGTTGQSDTSFQPLSPGPNQPVVEPADLLPQPDGSIVVVGALNLATFPVGAKVPVWRLLPTGALDQSFPLPLPNADGMGTALTQDAAGRLYVAGLFANFGGQPGTAGLVRLLASGQPDASFQVAPGVVSGNYHYTEALTVQPNGRVLLGGSYGPGTVGSDTGTRRLLADGSPDASYAPGNGPVGDAPTRRAGAVRRLLVQADGKLVVAGSFGSVGGLPVTGLARLLDPNVLGMRSSQAAGRPFTAWPVPAHHTLHLALEAATGSRQVELLNVLGQVVQTQAAPAATLSLNVQALPAGPYVLRVQDAAGVATRRVVLY